MLPQPLQAAVHGHIGIHDRYQRREQTDVISCLSAVVYHIAQHIREEKQKQGHSGGKQQAHPEKRGHGLPDPRLVAPHLGLGQLRDNQLRNGGHDAGGEENHRQHHALNDSVAGQRPIGGIARRFQALGHQQVLQGGQGASGIGGDRQRQGNAQHPPGEPQSALIAGVIAPPVGGVYPRHQQQGEQVGGKPSRRHGGTALFNVALRAHGEKQRHQGDAGELLRQVDKRGLPHPAHGGEVAGKGGAQGDAGHTEGGNLQGENGSGVPHPEKADGLCQKPEDSRRGRAEEQAVGRAAAHGAPDPGAVFQTQLLGDQPGAGKAYARYGHRGAEGGDRAYQLIKSYARRADSAHQPDLKGHADAVHQKG